MTKSMTERIKEWRKKKSAGGGRSLTIMLEPESVRILENLKEKLQESQARLIALALAAFNDSFTCKLEPGLQEFTCNDNRGPDTAPEPTESASIPWLKEIKDRLDQGETVMAMKEEIIAVMKKMKGMGYDSSQISDQLYGAGIKTMKGHERWEGGTIRKWWK